MSLTTILLKHFKGYEKVPLPFTEYLIILCLIPEDSLDILNEVSGN